ncbi:hypothetical protein BT96DRAFT_1086945, partial [Gymnopus androsaceus JB14]
MGFRIVQNLHQNRSHSSHHPSILPTTFHCLALLLLIIFIFHHLPFYPFHHSQS